MLLNLLKMDLGITHHLRDEYFVKLLDSCRAEIERKGIVLDELNDIEDAILIADYAAWSYRKRTEDLPLSRNIQHRIRNRILKERAKDSG
ncbi:hypothetical protein [Bacillus sp. 2205SS5-2]|uniref:hypothetical protein n=1 Tax=Bacillus sp. 2205SS5-2 TaxID=3109031 RepID=UPI0030052E97